jgi:hypothetical protein
MRWQRHSSYDTRVVLAWQRAARHALPSIAAASFAMAGMLLMFASPSSSVIADEVVEGGDAVDVGEGGKGMSASNPRVKPMLEAYPRDFVTVCVAGCAGKPSIVQILPAPRTARSGEMIPTAGKTGGSGRVSSPMYPTVGSNDVTCMAGCGGPSGQVLQRVTGLPPLPKVEASPEGGNEPLDN